MRRIFLPSVLLLLSCWTLAGCGREQTKQRELVIWESYNNKEHVVFLELVAKFQKKNPVPKIRVERVPFDGLLSKIITSAIANRTPDIARIDIGHLPRLAYGKVVSELSPFGVESWMREFLLPVLVSSNQVRVGNKRGIYAIPDQITNLALFYNKALFRKKGIMRPPRTWAEFVTTAKKITDKKAGIYGYSMNASLWWVLPILYSFHADVLTPDYSKCILDTAEGITAFTFLGDLYGKYGVESGAWRSGALNPDQSFVNGKSAMILSGPWNIKTFSRVPYGVSLIPGTKPGESATNVGGTTMVVFRKSRFKNEAVKFLKFLVSEEAQSTWSQTLRQVSVNKKVNATLSRSFPAVMRVFAKQALYARARPMIPNYDQLEEAVNPLLYTLLEGKISPAKMASKACQIIEKNVLGY